MQRGEIYVIDFPEAGKHVQFGKRPAVIVSNNINNRCSPVVVVVPCTGMRKKTSLPTHVTTCDELRLPSVILCEQIMTVPVDALGDYCGKCGPKTMRNIDEALKISLGL